MNGLLDTGGLPAGMRYRLAAQREGRLAPDRQLPLVIEPDARRERGYLEEWIAQHRAIIGQRLLSNGGVLFRGFDIASPSDFERAACAMEPELARRHPLDGDAIRRWCTEHTYEALDRRIRVVTRPLQLHNEDAFLLKHPSKVLFCCLQAPPVGGETPIVDCRRVLDSIPRPVLSRFLGRRITFPVEIPLATVVHNCGTAQREAREKICLDHGVEDVGWTPTGDLRILSRVPTVIRHPETHEPIWFNKIQGATPLAHAFSHFVASLLARPSQLRSQLATFSHLAKHPYWALRRRVLHGRWGDGVRHQWFEDGTSIQFRDQLRIVQAYWRNAVVLRWQQGDMLVLDNRLVAHGRMPYRGERFILSCMSQPSCVEAYGIGDLGRTTITI